MITSFLKNKIYLLMLGMGIGMAVTSCKKSEVDEPVVEPEPPVKENMRTNLTKDSIFLYAKEVYLWNESLPTYEQFNPRKYTGGKTDLDNYERELFDITQYSKSTETTRPYEFVSFGVDEPKYSYIDDITTRNAAQAYVTKAKADVELDGSGYDLGFLSFQGYGTETSYELYATAVFPGSPADKAGITRGSKITKINSTTIGSNFNGEIDLFMSLTEAETTKATVSGVKADGTAFTNVELTKVKYTSSPVYKSKTLTAGTKKIGYLAFARFSELNSNAKKDLDAAFSKFATDGVTDLIIDLRYNGGGYVSTAEYLTNLIAPASATGVMFKEHYNKTMQENKASILKNQPLLDENEKVQFQNGKLVTYADVDFSLEENTVNFNKKGALTGVTNVVFLVTGNTASASELVINNLKPVMTVKLVGKTTYGKPVGFFPVRIENKYDVYLSMFETRNKLDQGGYYAGIPTDVVDLGGTSSRTVFDDARKDFGDPEENYTKNAINILAPGAVVTTAKAVMSIRGKTVSVSSALGLLDKARPINNFIGMVETRHKIKK
jgi:carboxyl-terminal processing protease